MNAPARYALVVSAVWLALPVADAHAERADGQQQVQLEADRITIDDKQQMQVLEGAVSLKQGTLQLRADRIQVTQDAAGFQRGVAFGKGGTQAWFKQKREGRDEFVEGQADRIEYDARTERAEFFGNANVKNAQDVVSGPYILYDGKSESYEVSGQTQRGGATPGGRVRAVIQPRKTEAATPTSATPKQATPTQSVP